jgi:hypothetical protein
VRWRLCPPNALTLDSFQVEKYNNLIFWRPARKRHSDEIGFINKIVVRELSRMYFHGVLYFIDGQDIVPTFVPMVPVLFSRKYIDLPMFLLEDPVLVRSTLLPTLTLAAAQKSGKYGLILLKSSS